MNLCRSFDISLEMKAQKPIRKMWVDVPQFQVTLCLSERSKKVKFLSFFKFNVNLHPEGVVSSVLKKDKILVQPDSSYD